MLENYMAVLGLAVMRQCNTKTGPITLYILTALCLSGQNHDEPSAETGLMASICCMALNCRVSRGSTILYSLLTPLIVQKILETLDLCLDDTKGYG